MANSYEQLIGKSISIDSGDGLSFPISSSLYHSISLWIYVTSNHSGTPRAIISRGAHGSFPSLFLSSYDNSVTVHPTTDKDHITPASSKNIQLHTWTHVAAVVNGSTVSIFVDGELVNSQTCHVLPASSRCPIRLGQSTHFPNGIRGLLRDVRLYSSALSDDDILQIRSETVPENLFTVMESESSESPGKEIDLKVVPDLVEECLPFRNLAELFYWKPAGKDPLNVASVALPKEFQANKKRVIHCHDMKGGYSEDRFPQGASSLSYNFHFWKSVDIFIYFAHHRISIPPVGWINAAHKHGVQVLATFIVEWEGGLPDTLLLLENYKFFANQLVAMAQYYGFDGWFINIETELPSAEHANKMRDFIEFLTVQTHQNIKNSLVIWYDSVTDEGKLKWQNKLNEKNKMFFDVCDGIFLNYKWDEEYLKSSAALAGEKRTSDIFVGIDIFGRGTFGGGGFTSHVALELIHKYQMSVGLFAPGWTYEVLGLGETFNLKETRYWTGVMNYEYLPQDSTKVISKIEDSEWNVVQNGGDGWKIENTESRQLYVTSHQWCTRERVVDLQQEGPFVNLPNLLKIFPVIKIETEFIGTGPNFSDKYQLKVELRDGNNKVLDTFSTGELKASEKWQTITHIFTSPLEGDSLRYVYWQDGGRDAENWAGHFGTKIGKCSIQFLSTLPCNQLNTAIYLPNKPVLAQVPFSTSFNSGQGTNLWKKGSIIKPGEWFDLSLQDVQPSYHNTNENMSYIGGSNLMEGRVLSNESIYNGGSAFSICGRLHLAETVPHMNFFHFSLFDFANLTLTAPTVLSTRYLPLTLHSLFCIVLLLDDASTLLLSSSTSENNSSFFKNLSHKFDSAIFIPPLQINNDNNSQQWQKQKFELGQKFVGRQIRSAQILSYADPSVSTSNFSYHLILGKLSLKYSSSPISFSPLSSSSLRIFPMWSNSNISQQDESLSFNILVSWDPISDKKKEIFVDGNFVGYTLQDTYFIKNLKLATPKKIEVKCGAHSFVKFVTEQLT